LPRPGPLSSLASALGAFDLLLLAARIPATAFGLGWAVVAAALIASPTTMVCAVVARVHEGDPASRRAADRAVLHAGGSLALQLLLLLVLGP